MARDSMADVMQALGILAQAAGRIHATDVASRENQLGREHSEKMYLLKRDESRLDREDRQLFQKEIRDDTQLFQKEMMEDQQDFQNKLREDTKKWQKELTREEYNRRFREEYQGATLGKDGYYTLPEGYDYTQTSKFKAGQAIGVEEDLRRHGLDISGTSKDRIERLNVFLQARNKGANMMMPSVSPDISLRVGGDVTPSYLTSRDFQDFEEFYHGSGGSDSPIALQQIIDAGLINSDHLTIDKETGLYQANDRAKELISIAFQGLKKGAIQNENYMTNQQYEQYTETQRQQKLLYAGSLTGLPDVVRATNIFNDAKASIGRKINAQISEGGDYTLQWKGEQVNLNSLIKEIGKQQGVFTSEQEKNNFITFLDGIGSIGPDGRGLDALLQEINANPKLLKLLNKFDSSLARKIQTGRAQFNRISKVSNIASQFVEAPRDPEKIEGFRGYLAETGLSPKFQELRSLEASGDASSKEWQALDDEISKMISNMATSLMSSGNKEMQDDFYKWLELEEATSELFKANIERNR